MTDQKAAKSIVTRERRRRRKALYERNQESLIIGMGPKNRPDLADLSPVDQSRYLGAVGAPGAERIVGACPPLTWNGATVLAWPP